MSYICVCIRLTFTYVCVTCVFVYVLAHVEVCVCVRACVRVRIRMLADKLFVAGNLCRCALTLCTVWGGSVTTSSPFTLCRCIFAPYMSAPTPSSPLFFPLPCRSSYSSSVQWSVCSYLYRLPHYSALQVQLEGEAVHLHQLAPKGHHPGCHQWLSSADCSEQYGHPANL